MNKLHSTFLHLSKLDELNTNIYDYLGAIFVLIVYLLIAF